MLPTAVKVVRYLEAAGLEGSAILNKAEKPEYAKRLALNTQFAADRGVFGSPTFIVGEDLFFGNDRLDLLLWAAGKRASSKSP